MKNEMETSIIYRGYIIPRSYLGIMEENMETSFLGLGLLPEEVMTFSFRILHTVI